MSPKSGKVAWQWHQDPKKLCQTGFGWHRSGWITGLNAMMAGVAHHIVVDQTFLDFL